LSVALSGRTSTRRPDPVQSSRAEEREAEFPHGNVRQHSLACRKRMPLSPWYCNPGQGRALRTFFRCGFSCFRPCLFVSAHDPYHQLSGSLLPPNAGELRACLRPNELLRFIESEVPLLHIQPCLSTAHRQIVEEIYATRLTNGRET
jgi:hypothetical protein